MAVSIIVARRLSILRAQEARRRRESSRREDGRHASRVRRLERGSTGGSGVPDSWPLFSDRELRGPAPAPAQRRRPWDSGDDAVLIAAVTRALVEAEGDRTRVHWGRVARTVQDACGQILTGAEVRERYARTVTALDGPQHCALAPSGVAPHAVARFAEPLAPISDASSGVAAPTHQAQARPRSRFLGRLFGRRRGKKQAALNEATAVRSEVPLVEGVFVDELGVYPTAVASRAS